jgi:glyoxylase-like metal-dependent hydrolase (beta-lactamase superfamily II)
MICKELNHSQCKTYLVACEDTRRAVLIDPVRANIDRYLALLAYHALALDAVIDTHTHADHPSGASWLQEWTDTRLIMHTRAPTPKATEHVDDGDIVKVGGLELRVLYTPGHTPDSISLYIKDRVFTGDVLLIGGTGRADFAGGDSGEQYDAITEKLFTLPGDTVVYPAHDYRGNSFTTVGKERQTNPRIAGKSRQEYIDLMASIDFPLPSKIQEVLQPNQTAIDDGSTQRGSAVSSAGSPTQADGRPGTRAD